MASGNAMIVVKHGMPVVVQSDWVIDVGPGAGADDDQTVAAGTPQDVAKSNFSKTAPFLENICPHKTRFPRQCSRVWIRDRVHNGSGQREPGLIRVNSRLFDDWPPFIDLGLKVGLQTRRRDFFCGRNVRTQVSQPLPDHRILHGRT